MDIGKFHAPAVYPQRLIRGLRGGAHLLGRSAVSDALATCGLGADVG
jgi:hypothetical protein